jgi:hypothetical protein
MLKMKSEYPSIDQDLIDSFNRYLEHGIPFGSFLEAVMCNDLMGAVTRADWHNTARLNQICRFIYNEFPHDSHGSKEAYCEWLEAFSRQRAAKRASAHNIAFDL